MSELAGVFKQLENIHDQFKTQNNNYVLTLIQNTEDKLTANRRDILTDENKLISFKNNLKYLEEFEILHNNNYQQWIKECQDKIYEFKEKFKDPTSLYEKQQLEFEIYNLNSNLKVKEMNEKERSLDQNDKINNLKLQIQYIENYLKIQKDNTVTLEKRLAELQKIL